MKKTVLLLVLILASVKSFALDQNTLTFLRNTCKDIYGNRAFINISGQEGDAYATIYNGRPIIVITNTFWNSLRNASQAFVLAHECAHHALGHTYEPGGSHPRSEFEADCYATYHLVRNKVFTHKSQLLDVERDFYAFYGERPYHRSPSHPGTLERFDNVNQCFQDALRGKPMKSYRN